MKDLAYQQIEHYALQKELSHKANRQTFLAKDLHTQTPVILKVLQFGHGTDWDELKLFKREAQILQQLDHPSIPKYLDSFETEISEKTCFVLVQTYIAARSLQQTVESGQLFSETEAIAIARQLLTTLRYLHQQHPPVIHRDIKPSNILISDPSPKATANLEGIIERRIYLVDFGAVQVTASKTSGTVTIVGSYGYMPLEQFLGQTTPASDLYSLGMLFLYLVTGMHPAELPERDGRVQLKQIATATGLSDRFTHWLSQLTEPHAQQRFNSAEVALTVLNAKDGKNGYFPHLKPNSHHIHIHRQPNEIRLFSITLPKYKAPIAAIPISGMIFVAVLLGSILIGEVIGVLGVVAIAVTLLFLIAAIYKHFYRGIKRYAFISIHKTQGISSGIVRGRSLHNLRTFKKKQRTLPLSSINFISCSPKHTFRHFYNRKEKVKGRCHISIPAMLSVHTTGAKYTLLFDDLSVEEQTWINKELKDFLGLSLQTIAPADPSHSQASQIRTVEQQTHEKTRRITHF
ncbi:MAG: serine/threonine-protein kinase [Cyanobacteria bacterium J06581_3]